MLLLVQVEEAFVRQAKRRTRRNGISQCLKEDIMSRHHLYRYILDYVYAALAEEKHLYINALQQVDADQTR